MHWRASCSSISQDSYINETKQRIVAVLIALKFSEKVELVWTDSSLSREHCCRASARLTWRLQSIHIL